jgi:hypothetical protein
VVKLPIDLPVWNQDGEDDDRNYVKQDEDGCSRLHMVNGHSGCGSFRSRFSTTTLRCFAAHRCCHGTLLPPCHYCSPGGFSSMSTSDVSGERIFWTQSKLHEVFLDPNLDTSQPSGPRELAPPLLSGSGLAQLRLNSAQIYSSNSLELVNFKRGAREGSLS